MVTLLLHFTGFQQLGTIPAVRFAPYARDATPSRFYRTEDSDEYCSPHTTVVQWYQKTLGSQVATYFNVSSNA